jgi:hypothetical protein
MAAGYLNTMASCRRTFLKPCHGRCKGKKATVSKLTLPHNKGLTDEMRWDELLY